MVQDNEARALCAALDAIDSGDSNKAREALRALDGPGPQGAQRVLSKLANGSPVPPPIGRPARAAIVARLAEIEAATGDSSAAEDTPAHHPLVRVEPAPDRDPKPANELAPEADQPAHVELDEELDEELDAHTAADRIADALDGVEVLSGDEAVRATRALVCEAEHGAPIVEAAQLAAQLAAAPDARTRDRIALAPVTLRAAAALEHTGDHAGAAELRRVVKDDKVSLKAWDAGVRDALDAIRAAEVAADDEAARKAAALRREADEAARAAKAAEIERRRREAGEDRARYLDTFDAGGDVTFAMEPGRMTATLPRERPDGTPGRPQTVHLMNAAARIVAVVENYDQPDARPSTLYRVGFARERGAPFVVDIPAEGFDACTWINPMTQGRVVVSQGRNTRDLIRMAIASTRDDDTPVVRRDAFIGWVHREGRWMRLHAAGAIDAHGAVAGAEVHAPGKIGRYALPAPPEGEDRTDALDALREFAAAEPAGAVLPVLAFVVRSMIGPGAGICHVHGRPNTGKSHLCALALCLAGDFDGPRSIPGSWERDTMSFTADMLAVAGDAPWGLDDWRPDFDPQGTKFHAVARALFNMTGRGAMNRGRGRNPTPDPRASALSNGEALPTGGVWSGLSRVLSVELVDRVAVASGAFVPEPDDEDPARAFSVRAPALLARAGAALVQWLAPRLDTWRDPDALGSIKRLAAAERAALARWGVRESERTRDVIGPAALGAEVLHAFLRESGALSARELAHLDARTRDALAALAVDRRDTLEAFAPGRVFVETLARLLRGGACHAVMVRANSIVTDKPDRSPLHFGWRPRDGVWHPCGPTVAHLDPRHPGALCLDPEAAHAFVADALRREGRAIGIAAARDLAREISAAGLLAGRETAKRATVRTRVNGNDSPRVLVGLDALGFTDEDTAAFTATDTDEDTAA